MDTEEIAELLEQFVNTFTDHDVSIDFENIKNEPIISYIKHLHLDLDMANYELGTLQETKESLENDNEKLEQMVEEYEHKSDFFPLINGNDEYKKVILLKAFEKYSLQELENKLNLDWLSI